MPLPLPPPRTLVVAFAFFGYLGLALSVGNVYPLSTFEMYAGAPPTAAPSRVIARDAAGGAHEIDGYVGWRCDGPTPLGPAACPAEWPYAFTIYLDRAAADWVDAHRRGAASDGDRDGEPLEIVRRVYHLTNGAGPPAARDCVLNRCRAVRR